MQPVSHKTVNQVAGPLIFVDKVENAAYGEMVEITNAVGERVRGQVLDSRAGLAIVQVFGSTIGLNVGQTSVRFLGETARISVSDEMLGRVFDGLGNPRDKGPTIVSKQKVEIVGSAMNPYSREEPSEFIQTGISTIDGMNTLVRGQKLPIFSGSGLPHNALAAQIARQAKVLSASESFSVVFAAMGITSEEANYFIRQFEETGALERTVLFLNLSSDPSMERILTPRLALTTAEFLAYERETHVLVILTDMTNYCFRGDTEVLMSDGSIMGVGNYVESLAGATSIPTSTLRSTSGSLLLLDRSIVSANHARAFSWEDYETRASKIVSVQKVVAPTEMIYITTRSGAELSVTRDQKILIDTIG